MLTAVRATRLGHGYNIRTRAGRVSQGAADLVEGLRKGLPDPQPRRQYQPGLGPREDPGNGAESLDAATRFPAGGARSDIQVTQLTLCSSTPEVVHEERVLKHHGAVGSAAGGGELIHDSAPLQLAWAEWWALCS